MNVILWALAGLIGFNVLFFGTLYIIYLIDERRDRKHNEQH